MEEIEEIKKRNVNKTHKPHKSKIAGLKSVIVNSANDELVLTSFGKRNEAVIDQKFEYRTGIFKELVNKKSTFQNVLVKGNVIEIKDATKDGDKDTTFNTQKPLLEKETPVESQIIKKDYLELKDKLELKFWGKAYPNDNLHVQIAYNLLDIKKILGLQVNNVIFSFGNLQKGSFIQNNNTYDFIGSLCTSVSYDSYEGKKEFQHKEDVNKFIDKLLPYNLYFDNVFADINFKEDSDQKKYKAYSRNFDILRIVSVLRQFTSHEFNNSNLSCLFSSRQKFNDNGISHQLFLERIKAFNNDFLNNNQKLLYYILKLFPNENETTIIKDYYDYILFKGDKNLGISIKKIKEQIVKNNANLSQKLKEGKNISKLYPLLNFSIYKYYLNNPTIVENIRKQLRQTEGEKDFIYFDAAQGFANENPGLIDEIESLNDDFYDEISLINKARKKHDGSHKNIVPNHVNLYQYGKEYFSNISVLPFHEYIFVLSKFMDGKEVNELLTSLVNKFDNISSLVNVAKSMGIWEPFTSQFDLFNEYDFDELAEQFRFVNNICSMKRKLKKVQNKDDKKIKRQIYCDAVNMFLSDDFVSVKGYTTNEIPDFIDKLFEGEKGEHKGRNFLIKSIIYNRRFVYLCKYFDPTKCNQIIKNKKITKFLLMRDDMPLEIVERYYKFYKRKDSPFPSRKVMVDFLVNKLTEVNMDFILEYQGRYADTPSESSKQLLSLYLLLIYIFVKGMVHTNSIFFLAFGSLERDAKYNNLQISDDYMALSSLDKYKNKIKPRYRTIFDINSTDLKELCFDNDSTSNTMFYNFRNAIAHLNICTSFTNYIDKINYFNSYYDVFVYCLQYHIALKDNPVSTKINLKRILDEKHSYSKNFMKVLCLPFFYKLSTYKNLTIADLFNDKYEEAHQFKKEHKGELD